MIITIKVLYLKRLGHSTSQAVFSLLVFLFPVGDFYYENPILLICYFWQELRLQVKIIDLFGLDSRFGQNSNPRRERKRPEPFHSLTVVALNGQSWL